MSETQNLFFSESSYRACRNLNINMGFGRHILKHKGICICLFIFGLTLVLTYVNYRGTFRIKEQLPHSVTRTFGGYLNDEIFITVVACGSRLEETLTMIKSALLLNKRTTLLNFNIFAEDILKESFNEKLLQWQNILADKFSFHIHSLHFPKTNEKEWRVLFKPCAAQRLFLPSLLQNIDSTIYVDTDILFLSPAADLWSHFKNFNSSHIAGLSPEHEDASISWYNRFARHPFFGKHGVNSGVMLMNLTSMRTFDWENRMISTHKQYKSKITWGDQDLINIIFYNFPDKLYIFPCTYNYRPDHCMYMSLCNVTNGIRIIHGNRGYFHSTKQPFFKEIYEAFKEFVPKKDLYSDLRRRLFDIPKNSNVLNSSCGKIINQLNWLNVP